MSEAVTDPDTGIVYFPEDATAAELEFFSAYAQNYTEPEVVWLSRIIADAGPLAGPDSIARAVLTAGYARSTKN